MNPAVCEDGSLVYAKNMKVDKDGCLVSDYGYENIPALLDYNIVGHIVGLDNKIYFFTDEKQTIVLSTTKGFQSVGNSKEEYNPVVFDNNLDTSLYETPADDKINQFTAIPYVDSEGYHYYYLRILYKNDNEQLVPKNNTEDKYKLSKVSNNNDLAYYDNYFGFKIKSKGVGIKDYFEELYKQLEKIVNNFANIVQTDNKIIENDKLYTSKVRYKFFADSRYFVDNIEQISLYFITNSEAADFVEKQIWSDGATKVSVDEIGYEINVVNSQIVNTILEYDEIDKRVKKIQSAWKYSGGSIDGCVTTNVTGEKILTIGEYIENIETSKNAIPLKHINLSYCKYTDDESIYTQAPKVPIANLTLSNTYAKTIPNGVYVFFIRYEIRKDVFTNWYLCSRPMFAGDSEEINTIQGGLKYINLHRDSAKSFKLNVSFVLEENKALYNKFQLGFIISHDDSVNARSWKTFDINTTDIYFDYENVEEINIDNLKIANYELYNVGNITSFKNKLYIGNYIESNFNDEILKDFANTISLRTINKRNAVCAGGVVINGYYINRNVVTGYYDSLINGDAIRQIFNKNTIRYTYIQNLLTTSVTKENILNFEIWANGRVQCIAEINNITNYIRGNKVFGDSYNVQKGMLCKSLFRDSTAYRGGTSVDSAIQVYDINEEYPHPWFGLGLTPGYGYAENNNLSPEYINNDVLPFNVNTKKSYNNFYGWVFKTGRRITTEQKDTIINFVKDEIKKQSYTTIAYLYVTYGSKIYNIGYIEDYDANDYLVDGTKVIIDGDTELDDVNSNILENKIYSAIKSNIVGISEDRLPVLNIDGHSIPVSNITIVCKKYEFEVDDNIEDIADADFHKKVYVNLKTTNYKYNYNVKINSDSVLTNNSITHITNQKSTLMPHSTYKAYVHFVDEHNIISNGIYLQDIVTKGIDIISETIELQYSLTTSYFPNRFALNTKLAAFFISLKKVGDEIIEGFAYKKVDNNHYLHFIEIDSLLYNLNDNITIIDNSGNIVTTSAKYCSSGESNPILAFGNCGFVTWADNEQDYTEERLYIRVSVDNTSNITNNLIKCTNYIKYEPEIKSLVTTRDGIQPIVKTWKENYDSFYGSYLCNVKKPDFDLSSITYVSGKDIYEVTRQYPLILKEFEDFVSVYDSNTYTIRSNYNLNYLNLTEDINDQIFSLGNAASGKKQVAKVINSMLLSYIYELKSMYKDFDNVYFNEFTNYNKIKFDNTIRVSNTLADESFNNSVFTFYPTDYYNIPTNRGIIVKLFSIANSIMVHTKSSLYKFNTNDIIMSNEKDIQLKESNPFDNGIIQIFDSQYGYGGLDNKHSGCVTFDSYFFYDKASRHIFGYSGNSQIITIDDTINKFIKEYNPESCIVVHDEQNDRVLFDFVCSSVIEDNTEIDKEIGEEKTIVKGNNFCISYNYKTKSFVSFHDLTLNNAFNSRFACYSYNDTPLILFNNPNIIDNEKIANTIDTWKLYGDATAISIFRFYNNNFTGTSTPFSIAVLMQPTADIVESLDSVNYIANIIKSYIETNTPDKYSIIQEVDINPVSRFYAITNLCISSEIDNTINKTVRPNPLTDYKGFNYNLGVWQGNHFRNKLNETNIYKYPNQPGTGRTLVSDNNSLVYGRYFVLVFDFIDTNPIKFENININSKKY